MEKLKKNVGGILIAIVAILIGIIIFSYLVNPMKANITSRTEAMEREEAEAIGQNAIISEAVIIERQTGTGPFDSDDIPGNDSTEDNDIVRSFDQVK